MDTEIKSKHKYRHHTGGLWHSAHRRSKADPRSKGLRLVVLLFMILLIIILFVALGVVI
jgi:hypothetical protein